MMIAFMTYNTFVECCKQGYLDENISVVNFNSFIQDPNIPVIFRWLYDNSDPRNGIVQPQNIQFGNEEDKKFNDLIFNDSNTFYEFFKYIMYPFYSGLDVIILTSGTESFEPINESLQMVIWNRYRYTPLIVNEANDILYMNRDGVLDIMGIYVLDYDKNIYCNMVANIEGVPHDFYSDDFEDHADPS